MGGLFGGGNTSTKTVDPVVSSLQIQSSAYGLPIPILYGTTRISGNLIWYGAFTPIAHTTTQTTSGGKGGMSSTSSQTSWTYTASYSIGLCDGSIADVISGWKDKARVFNVIRSGPDGNAGAYSALDEQHVIPESLQVAANNAAYWTAEIPSGWVGTSVAVTGNFESTPLTNGRDYTVSNGIYTFFDPSLVGRVASISYSWVGPEIGNPLFGVFGGYFPQSTWPYLDSISPWESLNYPGVAYLCAANFDLGSNSSLPAWSFEVRSNITDAACGHFGANPRTIITDLLTNPHYGAYFSRIGDFTAFGNYCGSYGMFLAPCYDDGQTSAAQIITDLMQLLNSGVYFSEGSLKITPYGDASSSAWGYTYTAPSAITVNLGDDDFLVDGPGEPPVTVRRNAVPTSWSTSSDAYNQVSIEYLDRTNDYNPTVCTVQDQASIEAYGLIPMDMITAHQINDPTVAATVAQLILQRAITIRNQYEFRLGWNYAYLEPTDLVTITDATLGLSLWPVRILIVEEDETGELSITAEDAPVGCASMVQATHGPGGGYSVDYNGSPGPALQPVIVEPPLQLANATTGVELWIGATGKAGETAWGGAQVWISTDGSSYQNIGEITGPARIGHLTASIGASDQSMQVQLDGLGGQLLGASASDFAALATMAVIPGDLPEFFAYETATLTGPEQYTLSTLQRGVYGSAAAGHSASQRMLRLDSAVLHGDPISKDMIGSMIWVKLCSVNIWGAGTEDLSTVTAYPYTISGWALKSALVNVTGLTTVIQDGQTVLFWQPVTDPVRVVDYEVRIGQSWEKGQLVGRTPLTSMPAVGDGTYWVSAHSDYAYSSTPASIVLTGTVVFRNVVATWDEQATGWPGTCSGGAEIEGTSISLVGAMTVDDASDVDSIVNVDFDGGVAPQGTYTIPTAHEIDIGTVQTCGVYVDFSPRIDNPYDTIDLVADVDSMASIDGNYDGQAAVTLQLAVSDAAGVYGDWQDFKPGKYTGRKFKIRANLYSYDTSVLAAIDALAFTVDMPDRTEKGTGISVPAGGLAITYDTPFQVQPNLQITILNSQAGDDAVVTSASRFGFTVQVMNAGAGVARSINHFSQAY